MGCGPIRNQGQGFSTKGLPVAVGVPEPLSRRLRRLAVTLGFGGAGGALFAWAGLPAPWLAGAMVATGTAALSGIEVGVPRWARDAVFGLLGISIGAAVTWATLLRMTTWPLSMAMLALAVVAITWAQFGYYRRWFGMDRLTAYFAGLPGALSTVLATATAFSADVRRIAIIQSVRLFALVAVLPLAITAVSGAPSQGRAALAAAVATAASPGDTVLLVTTSAAAGLLLEWLGVPAGLLLGATLASAVFHLLGIVGGGLPDWLLIPGYVVLGALIGSRFVFVDLASIRRAFLAGVGGLAIGLLVSALAAAAVSAAIAIPFGQAWLAFAPGGLEAMAILAFALDLDPAFVGAHQIARFLAMSVAIPLIAVYLSRRPPERRD
jgi:membrane AbrB-like protein